MADENVRIPSDQFSRGLPSAGPLGRAGRDGLQDSTTEREMGATARGQRSEVELMLRWFAGLLFLLVCGWGLIALVALASRSWKIGIPWEVATGITTAISFVLLFVLEKNLWLSRFMGLRLGPRSTQLGEALILWFFGPVALLFRSTETAEAASTRTKVAPEAGGGGREVVETVVFVVILVLLLKSFVAEAFVIPTGSMAETLYGYQKEVKCPMCDYVFPVNCSNEVDPADGGDKVKVDGCTCPNCRWNIRLIDPRPRENGGDGREPRPNSHEALDPGPSTGDRVLVAKYIYDAFNRSPDRLDVVVFKFPGDQRFPDSGPQKNMVPMNYIKRLIGRPGETIGIYYGKLYWLSAEDLAERHSTYKQKYVEMAKEVRPAELWKPENMHRDDLKDLLMNGRQDFHIVRKQPAKILSMKRLVYDNDHPGRDLKGVLPPRWAGVDDGGAWKEDESNGFQATASGEQTAWLRYRHLLRTALGHGEDPIKPELITDFVGYNSYEPRRSPDDYLMPPPNWVGDLILECEINVDQPEGEFVLELSKGVDRFRARWDLASGKCSLHRLNKQHEANETPADNQFTEIDSKPTALKGKGTFRVRFANVDNRLTVWVDDGLPFGDGVPYEAFQPRGPFPNDLQPASIGLHGGSARVKNLKLWRDTYYTLVPGQADVTLPMPRARDKENGQEFVDKMTELHQALSDPNKWDKLRSLEALTLYVQPNHYLCLGDNSPESSDSRVWGLVPNRLLLGRALLVYYPFGRAGRIR
jgi:signal peptidase I